MTNILLTGGFAIPCDSNTNADKLWAADRPLPDYNALPLLKKTEHHVIHGWDERFQFTLGVSIAEHQGVFYAGWGTSAKDENDAQSVFAYATSRDGVEWSEMKLVAPNPDGPDAYSHGVLLSNGGNLWAFTPRAQFADPKEFPELRMAVFLFNKQEARWELKSETARGFWPLCEPQKMENGNWILGGARPMGWPRCEAAVAISKGENLTQWHVVTIPGADNTWGETAVIVDGPHVQAFIRPADNGLPLRTAISSDYGQHWSAHTASNFPVSASKPYAGILSNGSRYLIVNIPVPGLEPRDTLAIATSLPGQSGFTDLHLIRQGKSAKPRSSGWGIHRQWAYPYAIERDGKLYVVYAGTKQSAELTIVDLQELQPGISDNP